MTLMGNSGGLMRNVAPLFGMTSDITTLWVEIADVDGELREDERQYIAQAVDKRVVEFTAGRELARYALTSIGGIAILTLFFVTPDAAWLTAGTLIYVLLAVILHFSFSLAGIALVDGYVYFPIEPRWVYALTDVVQAISVGAAAVSYAMDSDAPAALLAGAGMLVLIHALQCYKCIIITIDVGSGKRDTWTGALKRGWNLDEE